MKKNYITPTMEIMTVQTQRLMAGSVGSNKGIGYGGVDTNGTKDPSSRHNNGWWDDEDEDW